MSLVTWQGRLLLTNGKLTLGPAADECCCVEDVHGCFSCIDPGNPSLWEVCITPSFTGCWTGLNYAWGCFALETHPLNPDWCSASGTLPPACGYDYLGFYWTWRTPGEIHLELVDTSTSPPTVLCDLSVPASGCDIPFTVTVTGACGSAECTVRLVP